LQFSQKYFFWIEIFEEKMETHYRKFKYQVEQLSYDGTRIIPVGDYWNHFTIEFSDGTSAKFELDCKFSKSDDHRTCFVKLELAIKNLTFPITINSYAKFGGKLFESENITYKPIIAPNEKLVMLYGSDIGDKIDLELVVKKLYFKKKSVLIKFEIFQLNIRKNSLHEGTLASQCAKSLMSYVNFSNVLEFYEFANRHNAKRLEEKCSSLILL
jgi:hypothetical protein